MQLLVSDFDGTYFLNEEDIKINNQMIKQFMEKGNIFMLSSGRSFKSLKEMTQKYHIPYDYLSCCDGSILYDKNDNIVIKYNLNSGIIQEFLNLQKEIFVKKVQHSYPDDYYDTYHEGTLIGLNLVVENENITKDFLDKYKKLAEKYIDYDFLHYKHDDITFFCLKNKGINKSTTVKYLKSFLNLNYQDIITVGDNENDFKMLECFNSYYIGNVDEKIKKVCLKGYNSLSNLLEDMQKND